jgi:hypothetical protein
MLPPPLIIFSHIYLLIKLIIRYCRGKKFKVDQGLSLYFMIKSRNIIVVVFFHLELFLSEKEVAEIHDFEEEQIDEYFAMKDREKKNTTAEQIARTAER